MLRTLAAIFVALILMKLFVAVWVALPGSGQ